MNETEVFKKALKRAFVNQILVPQLIKKQLLRSEGDLYTDDKGNINLQGFLKQCLQSSEGIKISELIRDLVSELADVSVELWLKTEKDKKG